MTQKNIACYQHPSTVWFVDDNNRFLNNIILQLDENSLYEFYDKPVKALKQLKSRASDPAINTISEYISGAEVDITSDQPASQYALDINLYKIHQRIYNNNRFQEPSVIVTDYAMPSMNGLDLCRKIKDLPAKKLMITGEADYSLAVEAFNEGIIDQFILKEQHNFYDELKKAISDMQKKYFIDMSQSILETLAKTSYYCLGNKNVQQLLKEYLNDKCEFYLMDCAGSYLAIDYHGNVSCFLISSKNNLDDYHRIALDNEAPPEITDSLGEGTKLLHLWHQADYERLPQNWQLLMHPAQPIADTEYYYHISMDKDKLQNYDKVELWQNLTSVL